MVRTRAAKRAAAAAAKLPAGISFLPEELLLHVLVHCSSPEDLVACARVARTWKQLAMDASAWSRHWQLAYGSRPSPVSPVAAFARLRVCGQAAVLLGELEYVGFYQESLHPQEKYHMAFWLRAWPSWVCDDSRTSMVPLPGISGVVNYVFLEPAPELGWYPGCCAGYFGGEQFVATWDWKSRTLRGKGTRLVDGNSAAKDMLVLTPQLDLQLDPTGHGMAATQTFLSGAMATRSADHPLHGRPHHEVVRMEGVLRDGEDPLTLLRGMRPNADLTHLPPGDSWRPKAERASNGLPPNFPGFDVMGAQPELAGAPRARLQAAMQGVMMSLRDCDDQ